MAGDEVRVRGGFVLSSVEFVRATFGAEAHRLVVAALPQGVRESFSVHLHLVREASWEALQPAVVYMETAKKLLAPEDPGFYRRMGRFAGGAARNRQFKVMVASVETALRMMPTLGRAYIDVGHIEVSARWDNGFRVRIHGYPAVAALCERRVGAWEVFLGSAEQAAHVTETTCVTRGSAYCEMEIVYQAV